MKTIEKLQKADKTNSVTKKDGTLKQYAIDAIKDHRNGNNKFYTVHTSGSKRFTTNIENNSVLTICQLLNYRYEIGNDSLRGGKTGNYIKVSKMAFDNIKSLIG